MNAVIKRLPVPENLEETPAEVVPFPVQSDPLVSDPSTPSDDEALRDSETEGERILRQSLYHEIKRKLIERGIPEHEIAFIHTADTPSKKAHLIDDVNAGNVRVLLGSTSKMGVAMNAQERMVALHHLDAPWRPRDVEQREGRIVRQGNIFDEVFILQYVTKGSMDCYTWQILESKAKFIHQIMSGEVTQRTADDIGDMVLTAGQVKAVASGNPKVMERVQLEIHLTKLERLRAAYYNNRSSMRYEISYLPKQIATAQAEVDWHQQSLKSRQEFQEGEFAIRLKKSYQTNDLITFTKRQDAGRILRHLGDLALDAVRRAAPGSEVHEEVGEYRGFKVYVHASHHAGSSFTSSLFNNSLGIELRTDPLCRPYIASFTDTDAGIIQSIDYQLRSIEEHLSEATARKLRLEKKHDDIQAEIAKPWKHLQEYKKMRRRYERLASELQDEGVSVEAGVIFTSLTEEELQAPADDEDGSEGTAPIHASLASEAGSQNSLTGLETDLILVPNDPRLSAPQTPVGPESTVVAPLATDSAATLVEASVNDSNPGETKWNTHLVGDLRAQITPLISDVLPTDSQQQLFGQGQTNTPSRSMKKRKEPDPNQIGFAFLDLALAATSDQVGR